MIDPNSHAVRRGGGRGGRSKKGGQKVTPTPRLTVDAVDTLYICYRKSDENCIYLSIFFSCLFNLELTGIPFGSQINFKFLKKNAITISVNCFLFV